MGLLSAACLITTSSFAETNVNVTHTVIPSKAPIYDAELEKRYVTPPQYAQFDELRLSKDIGNQFLYSPKDALLEGKNWYGLQKRRVNPFLEQYPAAKQLVTSYMFRQAITDFEKKPNTVTIQEAIDDELGYDFLNQKWSLNDIKFFIANADHPFVGYHQARLTPDDYALFVDGVNYQPNKPGVVTSVKEMVVHGRILKDIKNTGAVTIYKLEDN